MSDFEAVKHRIDLTEFIKERTGGVIKRVGASNDLSECPFCGGHDCFRIDNDKQLFKCHQCDAGGDVFSFLETGGLDKAAALREAAVYAGVELQTYAKPDEHSTQQKIFKAAVDYYEKRLWANGKAAYLRDVRKRAQATLETMRVGYADGGLTKFLIEAGFEKDAVIKSGLAKENGQGLKDYFAPGLYIYPHVYSGRVTHFTQKDPDKKLKYQLPNIYRDKSWRFYNQDALVRHNEIVVVEGENDLQAWMDAGVKNVIGLIGSPSQEQITALRNFCKNKHLYLCLDNDEPGRNHARKIIAALADPEYIIKVVVFDPVVKDIDEYFRDHAKDNKQAEAKRLIIEAITPIGWELSLIKTLAGGLEEKLKELKEQRVFERMADLVEVEKEVYVEKLIEMGFTKKAIEQQLESGHSLLDKVRVYIDGQPNKKDADPNIIADIIYKGLAEKGRWFYDREAHCFLFYQHRIYRIGNNRPFNALIKKHTRLLPTKEPGRSVWESIESECYNAGTQVQVLSWLHTDRKTDSIYVNFNSEKNTILKIRPRAVEEIPNGTNQDEVLLNPSKRIMPFNYMPDVKMSEGMELLKRLIFDNLAVEREQKYLIITWLISCFLIDYAPYAGLMKFSGHTSSGKTTAAKLLSLLIYGDPHLSDPTSSAAYTIAAGNPLLVIDNLESDDITKSILKFLLLSATKGAKEKRAGGTDSETIEESPKALVLVTAIEPFPKAELINRTYEVEFAKRWWGEEFFEDDVLSGIIKNRDIILSSVIKLISHNVLPNMERRRDYNIILKKEYRGHSKERTNEFLALMMLLLDVTLKHIPYHDEDELELLGTGASQIWRRWIEYQDSRAKETETDTNPMVTLFNALWREHKDLAEKKGEETWHGGDNLYLLKHEDYGLEMSLPSDKSSVEFEASSHDLFMIFSKLCKNVGMRNPYSNARQLGVRLLNDEAALKEGNWVIVRKDGSTSPYSRIVHGERFIRFRKVLKEALTQSIQ